MERNRARGEKKLSKTEKKLYSFLLHFYDPDKNFRGGGSNPPKPLPEYGLGRE
jgi:hypothetical protein